jgi:hypothetical protein
MHLGQARKDGGIGHVPLDPLLPIKAFFDIGPPDTALTRLPFGCANSSGQRLGCLTTSKVSGSRLASMPTN